MENKIVVVEDPEAVRRRKVGAREIYLRMISGLYADPSVQEEPRWSVLAAAAMEAQLAWEAA